MVGVVALVPLAYLVGTFPTAELVARARGHDVTQEGSGNPGASNIYRILGRGPASLVFAGDIGKGALPALAGLLIAGHGGGYVLGAAAVLGHVYPVTRRFRGGRGVATSAGLAFVLYPLVSLALLVVFFLISTTTHRASIASIVITLALPPLVWASGGEPWDVGVGAEGWEVALVGALSLLVVARHSANVRRLIHGEELRLDLESGSPGDPRGPGPSGPAERGVA
ncbi:MAG: glycerol-3-phosphate acyltransferase [Actinobacteria bacterium]|nr:glycerol-3-phosphate acyltransferase [Actinomycetota bacterium]